MGFWQKVSGIFGAGARNARTPEQVYVDAFLALARAHPAVEQAEASEGSGLTVTLKRHDGGQETIFLENTFRETRDASTDEKLARMHGLLSMLDGPRHLTWDEAAPALVPLLRMATFGVVLEAPSQPVSQPFAPCLRVYLGVDRGDSTRLVYEPELTGWGQTEPKALTRAVENLSQHAAAQVDAEPYDTSVPYPIWHVTRDDSYEASRLALPGYLASFRGKVNGAPIAIVPHRTLVLISGDGDDQAIARLAATAEAEFNAAPRAVSCGIYTLSDDDRVVPLHLSPSHPLFRVVEDGHKRLLASGYAGQKAQLVERFEKEGTDIFVATFQLLEDRGTQALFSAATVTRGVLSLLPVADRVCFVPLDESKPFVVAWDVAMTRAEGCFEAAPEYDPPRVRTVAWPDGATLAELRRLAEQRG